MSDEDLRRLADLHDRLCRGDRAAVGAFFLVAAAIIEPGVRGRRRIDPEHVHDAITETLRRHWQRPDQFDVERRVPLHEYLIAAARNTLSNILRSERRLKDREKGAAVGRTNRGENIVRESPLAVYLASERLDEMLAVLTDERDRQFLRLLANNVDDVSRLAAALGEAGGSPEAQARAVARAKERVRKRLKRRGLHR